MGLNTRPSCVELVGYATSDNIIAGISLETSKADWQVSRQYAELHTTPVSKVVDRLTESVEPFKDRLDESAPVTSVLHSGTETSVLTCSATKIAFPNQLARNGHLPVFPKNSWHSELPRRRNPHDDERLVKFKKTVGTDGVDLSLLSRLIDPDDDISSQREVEVEVIEDFCRGIKLEDVELGIGIVGSRKAVWLDDRGDSPDLEGNRDTRQYGNPLTPTELLQALTRNIFNDNDFPDAERRLIYITGLDPACIHTLAATASRRHKPVLINAIYNHLAFQPSIAVKIPSAAFPAFQFQVHLPFFALRKCTPPRKYVGRVSTSPHRRWIDLSFPKLDTPESQEQEQDEVWGIHEAHISCVITGLDDGRWVGYSFVDTDVDGRLTDLSKKDLSFDQIAARKLEENLSIWSPREYWLRVFEIRISQVREEWDYLIKKMELSVDQYIDKNALNMPLRSGTITEKVAELKKASDWAVQAMDLLPQLNRVLSDTIKAWRAFSSSGKNIGYFSHTDAAALSLRRIDAIFR